MPADGDSPELLPCAYCGMRFPTAQRRDRHVSNSHPEDQVIVLAVEGEEDLEHESAFASEWGLREPSSV